MPENNQLGAASVGIDADLSPLKSQIASAKEQIGASIRGLTDSISKSLNGLDFKKLGQNLQSVSQIGRNIGGTLTATVTAPLVGIGALAAKTGIEFESAFAGVRKTVNATEPEFQKISAQLRDLAKQSPISAAEFASIGEAAGQLGISTPGLVKFTDTMAKLGATTNLSSTEAATALARFRNITKLPEDQIDRLGSTIVDLGNNMATTESEIVDFGLRIASAGHTIGLTDSQILAFGATLSSVGINAEAGGTALSKLFVEIASSASTGGKKLEQFAQVAGYRGPTAAKQFAAAFKKDAAGAVISFITGLGKIQKSGGPVFQVIESLGLQETRLRNALLATASAGELAGDAMKLSGDAFAANTALNKEFQERVKTTASQLKILANQLEDVGITLFQAIAPTLKGVVIPLLAKFVGVLAGVGQAFAKMPAGFQGAIIAFAALAAAAGPVILILSTFLGSIGSILLAAGQLGLTWAGVTAGIAAAAGPIGIAVAAAAALAGAAVAIYKNWDKIGPVFKSVWDGIKSILGPALDTLKGAFSEAFGKVKDAVVDALNGVVQVVHGFVQNVKDTIAYLWPLIRPVLGVVADGFRSAFSAIADIVKGVILVVGNIIAQGLKYYGGLIKIFGGLLTGQWGLAWEGAKQVFSAAWDTIDKTIRIGLSALGSLISDFLGFWGRTASKLAGVLPSAVSGPIQGLADALNTGKELARGFAEEVNRAAPTVAHAAAETKKLATATQETVPPTKNLKDEIEKTKGALNDTGVDMDLFGEKTKKTKDAVAELKKAFQEAEFPLNALSKDISTLLKQGFSQSDIAQTWSDKIADAAKAQTDLGHSIPGALQGIVLQAQAFKLAKENAKTFADEEKRIHEEGLKVQAIEVKLPPALNASVEAMKKIGKERLDIRQTADQIVYMKDAGVDAKVIVRSMGSELDDLRQRAKDAGVELDDTTLSIIRQAEKLKKDKEEAEKWQKVWENAMGSVVSDFTDGVTNMLFEGDKFSLNLKSIFKDLAKSIVKIMVTDAFTGIAKGFSGLLGGLFGGKGGGGGGFSLGGLAGGGIKKLFGGLFGGGAAAGGTTAAGAGGAAGAAGGIGGGLSGLGGTIGALATNPITIAAAGALGVGLLAKKFIGKGRRTANEFVQNVQNPLGTQLAGIIDPITAKKAAGTLTPEDVKSAIELLSTAKTDFQTAGQSFAAQGSTESKVVGQAHATLDPIFANLMSGLQKDLADLNAAAPAEGTPAALANLDFQPFTLAVDTFGAAVDKFAAQPTGAGAGPITIDAPTQITISPEINIDGTNLTPLQIRDIVIPEITLVLETKVRGVAEKWAQILHDMELGLVTTQATA